MNIGPDAIAHIMPIVNRIDAELRKEPHERRNFRCPSTNPKRLKTHLTNYKTHFRQVDTEISPRWHGRFTIFKREDAVEIRFGVQEKYSFVIEDIPDEAEAKVEFVLENASPQAQVPHLPMLEFTEDETVQHLLINDPDELLLFMPKLKESTQAYFQDKKNATQKPALAITIEGRGYKWRATPHSLYIAKPECYRKF